jgi:hypothetical protein
MGLHARPCALESRRYRQCENCQSLHCFSLLIAIQSAAATDVAPEPLGVDVVEQVLHAVPPRSITGMRPRESPVI